MPIESRARTLAESAMMAALTVVLALVTFYVPFVGSVLTFFLPAPVALVTARRGMGAALSSVAVAGLVLVLFLGPVQALALVSVFAFMGLALGVGIGRGWDAGRTIVLGGLAVVLTVLASLAISRLFFHEDVVSLFLQSLSSSADQARRWHLPGAESYARTLQAVAAQVRANPFLLVGPGTLAVLAVSALFYAGLRPLFRRIGQPVPRLTSFAAWRLPYAAAWVWFATMLLVFLEKVPALHWAGVAGTYLYGAFAQVFMVIGASVAYFLFRYFRMSVVVSAILAALFAVSPVWSTLLLFAGLFETLFGLRGRLLARLAPNHALRAELSPEAWSGLERSLRPFLTPPPPRTPAGAAGTDKRKAARRARPGARVRGKMKRGGTRGSKRGGRRK